MAVIGKYNTLKVLRFVEFGAYLDGEIYGDILLPKKYFPEGLKEGDDVHVFVYYDSEGRPIATTETPKATVGQFAALETVSVTTHGAFMDWGLIKDLFVPHKEMKRPFHEGDIRTVFIYRDEASARIAASEKIDKFISEDVSEYSENDQVEILVANETDLGFNVIVNNKNIGLVYKNQIHTNISTGHRRKAFIAKVREDNKLDISLYPKGYKKVKDEKENILQTLKDQGGFIEVGDKSSPEEISSWFGISKKTFKQAIGALYKERIIDIEIGGIRLL